MNKMLKLIGGCAAVLAITLVAGVPSAEAASKKNLTQASVDVWAWCDLDGADFTVNLRVEDASSGATGAELRNLLIIARQKTGKGPWGNQTLFDTARPVVGPESLTFNHSETFDVCLTDDDPDAKAVNANVTVTYGRDGGVGATRVVTLMCGDNPTTTEVESSGKSLADFNQNDRSSC